MIMSLTYCLYSFVSCNLIFLFFLIQVSLKNIVNETFNLYKHYKMNESSESSEWVNEWMNEWNEWMKCKNIKSASSNVTEDVEKL